MNLNQQNFGNQLGRKKSFKLRLGAVALVTAAVWLFSPIVSERTASAAASWSSSQPSWASSDGAASPTSRRPSYAKDSRYAISPFSPDSNNVALDVGQVFLMGGLSDRYSDSIGSQLHYTYGVSDIFGFDSSFGYSNHSDGKYSMTTLLSGLRTNLTWYDRVVPYGVFGLGFYKPTIQVSDTASISSVVFGVHMGAGVDLQLTNMLFFGASLTFHDIFGQTKTGPKGPVDLGGTFTSFLLHAGFTF